MPDQFKALIIDQKGEEFTREVKSIDKSFLKHGDVTIKVDYSDLNFKDGMILKKSEEIHSAELNSENDHRLFMAFSIVGMFVGDCTVSDPDAVKVSYPAFISDMKNVGADLK